MNSLLQETCNTGEVSSPMKKGAVVYQLNCKAPDSSQSVTTEHSEAKQRVQQVLAKQMRLTDLHKLYPKAYNSHRAMKDRCKRENIILGKEIASFTDFLNLLGPPPALDNTLDRINSKGNYEFSNLRWASKSLQSRNRAITVMLTAQGQTKPLIEWADTTGQTPAQLRYRRRQGWPDENVISGKTPLTLKASSKSSDEVLMRYGLWPQEFAVELEISFQKNGLYQDRLSYLHEIGPRMVRWISDEADLLPPPDHELTEQQEEKAAFLERHYRMWSTSLVWLKGLLKPGRDLTKYRNLPFTVEQTLRERYRT